MGRVFSYLKRKDIYRPDLSFRNGSTSPPFPSTHLTNNIKYKGKRTNGRRKDHLFRRQICNAGGEPQSSFCQCPPFPFFFFLDFTRVIWTGRKGQRQNDVTAEPPNGHAVIQSRRLHNGNRMTRQEQKKRDRHIPLSISGTRPSCDRLTNTWTEADPPSPGTRTHRHGRQKEEKNRY